MGMPLLACTNLDALYLSGAKELQLYFEAAEWDLEVVALSVEHKAAQAARQSKLSVNVVTKLSLHGVHCRQGYFRRGHRRLKMTLIYSGLVSPQKARLLISGDSSLQFPNVA